MPQEKNLKLVIGIGRLITLMGAVMYFYLKFIQGVSPPAEIILLMIIGTLTIGIAGLVRWVKTGALK